MIAVVDIIKNNNTTKNIEVRHCDWLEEIKDKAEKLHIEYYGKVGW